MPGSTVLTGEAVSLLASARQHRTSFRLSQTSVPNGTQSQERQHDNRAGREKQLRDRLTVLEGRLHRIDSHLEQPADKDWEENATASEMDEVLEQLGHAGKAEIQAIHAAIDRLKSGSYGICARCGVQISEERLNIVPHSPLCEGCARAASGKN